MTKTVIASPLIQADEIVGLLASDVLVAPAIRWEDLDGLFQGLGREGRLPELFPLLTSFEDWYGERLRNADAVNYSLARRNLAGGWEFFGIAWTGQVNRGWDGQAHSATVGIASLKTHRDGILAARMALRFLFLQLPFLRVATAEIPASHKASRAVAIAAGMSRAGVIKNGTMWHSKHEDLVIYSIQREDIETLVKIGDGIDAAEIVR